MSKRNKYVFTLNNIDVIKVCRQYGINSPCNIETSLKPDNTTDLSSLRESSMKNQTPEKMSFLDQSKRLRSCTLSKIDFDNTDYWCWWCKHSFDTPAWGCPLKIQAHINTTSYTSSISKTFYTLREKQLLQNNTCTYITEGVFCSVNCCRAWAEHKENEPGYEHSLFLLKKMYNQIKNSATQSSHSELPSAAPDWRLLDRFGGYLNINKFREDIDKIDYTFLGKTMIAKNPVSYCFEEKLKF